ncbi:MAG: toxic anion resistance protein, partial [Weissella cibaria]
AQVDNVAARLDRHKETLLADNKMLDGLFQQNLDFFKQLNVYIAGAEMKLSDVRNRELPAAREVAQASGDQLDAQKVQDLVQFEQRLEKRSNDLKLTRQVALQQAPQIRLIQSTNQVLAEKIQSSISTAIPLWKNQVAIALTLLKQKNAVAAQRAVADTTNQLLQANSEMLKQSAVETAKENERGVIDIETLQNTQANLIETIEETMQIQRDGRQKRADAEVKMQEMETELKQKLLAMADESVPRKNVN